MLNENTEAVGAHSDQNNVESSVSAESFAQQPTEKLIPESEVNNRIRHAVGRVREKTRQEMMDSFQSQNSNVSPTENTQPTQNISEDQLRKVFNGFIQEYSEKAQHEQNIQQGLSIAQEFMTKIYENKDVFGDKFDHHMSLMSSSLQNIPEIVKMANEMPNTAEVVKDLYENPSKLAMIKKVHEINPNLAAIEMKKISDALNLNRKAAKVKLPDEPLAQIKQTNTGLDNFDVNSMSVSDFRKMLRQ